MAKEYSPFTPGVPVPIEFFVGREREITEIVDHVARSASRKSLERIFITGDRGIGKSSLCRMALRIAEEKNEVLGLHVFLGGVTSLEEMVRRIFERLLQVSQDRSWFESVRKFLGNNVREVGLFGVSLAFEASQRDLSQAVGALGPTLHRLLKQIGQHRKGMMIVLDDLNGLAADKAFANWLKSFVDELATSREELPLTMVLAGMPERRTQLVQQQPSLDRVFDIINISAFNEVETRQFYQQSLAKVNVRVSPAAMDLLWRFSGGYPVFLHEIGDAVFKSDTDGVIDENDALSGIVRAAEIIGIKYIEPRVLDAIWSKRYRQILKRMVSTPLQLDFSKAELVARVSTDEARVVDNFLRKIKQLGVVQQSSEMGRGKYRFASQIYALYFYLQSVPRPAAN